MTKMLSSLKPAAIESHLLSRFWQSALGFWRRPIAYGLAALLAAIIFFQLLVQYQISFWNRDFFNAIERKDEIAIWTQAIAFLPLAAGSLTLALATIWGRMTAKRRWREWLSKRLYDYWLEKGHSRKLQFMPGDHQTPEYRIAEDAKVATDLPIDLLFGLLWSILSALTFIGILWSVGGDLPVTGFGTEVTIPKYLVITVVVYSVFVTGATMIIGRRLTAVIEDSKRAEAELRSIGAHIRESSEGTVDPDDRPDSRMIIRLALAQVIAKWLAICWQNIRMALVAHTNYLVTPIFALMLCMPKFIAGTMTLGEVVQAAAAFVIVQTAFNWITDNYGNIAEWMSSANRVASLLIALDQIDHPD